MEINLKSENLLENYKNTEQEIMKLQLEASRLWQHIEGNNEYKEMKDIEQKIGILQKQNEDFKSNVKEQMMSVGLKSLETRSHKITLKGTVGSLKIENQDLIPQTYIKEVKPVFDNAKIKNDIKAGVDVPGATVEEGWSLMITSK